MNAETVVSYARSGRAVTAPWMDLSLAAQRSLLPGPRSTARW
ncbi:hypothetical protein ACFY0N_38935 [Streptomyces vinaceus]